MNKVACSICGQLVAPKGMRLHMTKHKDVLPSADMADVNGKLEQAGDRIKELEAQLADAKPAELGEEDRLAVLGDWLDGLTKEAWIKIGEQAGYWDSPPAPVAEVSDVKVDEKPAQAAEKSSEDPKQDAPTSEGKSPVRRRVYLPDSGLVVTMEASQ